MKTSIRSLSENTFFTFKDVSHPTESQVWIRNGFDRSSRKYLCTKFDDISVSRLVDGSKLFYTDFIF